MTNIWIFQSQSLCPSSDVQRVIHFTDLKKRKKENNIYMYIYGPIKGLPRARQQANDLACSLKQKSVCFVDGGLR